MTGARGPLGGPVAVPRPLSTLPCALIQSVARHAAGAKLFYLPPYSPDLNPIEEAFAKLKTLLHKESAQTIEGIEKCIAGLILQINPDGGECLNYFQDAGYTST